MREALRTKRGIAVAGVAALAIAAGGVGVAAATGGDDDAALSEQAIPASAIDQASQAALDEVGEGTVTETEVGDEESLYEVEVTRDDGSQVDVQLDREFNVVGSEDDGAGEDEGAEADE